MGNFEHCLRHNFLVVNNETEYETFIARLRFASKLKVLKLHIFSDSKLIFNQVTQNFEVWGAKMANYLAIMKILLSEFKAVKIEQVGKDLNSHSYASTSLTSIF